MARKKAAPKKTVGGRRLPRSAFAITGKAGAPSTWKLPVKTASGAVDRRRLGAAHAALTVGYRGRKVQGPGKATALKKVNALRRSPPGAGRQAQEGLRR